MSIPSGGRQLDLSGHIVLLNFSSDPTAVALLRLLARDVAGAGPGAAGGVGAGPGGRGRGAASPLQGRPLAILAAPGGGAGGGGGGGGGSGGGGGDAEAALKRIVADVLRVGARVGLQYDKTHPVGPLLA